jgi:hypothetical protein
MRIKHLANAFLNGRFSASTPNRIALLWSGLGVIALAGFGSAQETLWEYIGSDEGFGPQLESGPRIFDQLGDMDGDGVGEFIQGYPFPSKYVSVRSGATGEVITRHYYPSENLHDTGFGTAVANLGLMDGDGIPDYAISAPGYSASGQAEWAGLVQVFSGATHQEIFRIHENIPGERLGGQIATLGDVNGDGFVDFGISPSGSSLGPFRVYLGPDGTFLREHPFTTNSTKGVALYGDYNGDGCDDYLKGYAHYSGKLYHAGRVELFSGKDGSVLLTMDGDQAGRFAGDSVCPAGDWNGDGIVDVAAGAPGGLNLVLTSGLAGAYIFSGADGSILRFFDGEQYCNQNSLFGHSVSSGKDVNGDGTPDLIVGAPLEPYQGSGLGLIGSAFVFSGATGSLLWEHKGTTPGEKLGRQVEFIDDHDGDGIDEWMTLSPDHNIDFDLLGDKNGRLSMLAGAMGDAYSVCSGGPNSVGDGAVLWNSGPISVEENEFELAVSEMPQGSLALLIHGQLAPSNPFGAGELCLGLPISVLEVTVTDSDGAPGEAGEARVALNLRALPFTAAGNTVRAGDHWAFQVLYRDQGQRNTSNALDVVFVP